MYAVIETGGKQYRVQEGDIITVEKLNVEADEIISEGKIEDVLFYFDKLDANEKKECLEKIMAALKG